MPSPEELSRLGFSPSSQREDLESPPNENSAALRNFCSSASALDQETCCIFSRAELELASLLSSSCKRPSQIVSTLKKKGLLFADLAIFKFIDKHKLPVRLLCDV